MTIFQKYLSRIASEIKHERIPWAALMLIPVIIISGAYWTSIPFYGVITILWLFQRKAPFHWRTSIFLMTITLLGVFVTSKTDYAFWIYTIKIMGCFIIVISLRPKIHNHQRFWIDIYFAIWLGIIWETNAYVEFGRWTFDMGFGRSLPNWTAIYCFLFAMLAVRWKLPLSLIATLTIGWLTGSRNFALALGVVGIGYLFLPIFRWVFSKTSRTIVLYLFFAVFSLWILDQITKGQWTVGYFFGGRILNFVGDSERLTWATIGMREWTENLQIFTWGIGDWPNAGPNPHHSLIHTLLERGIVVTSILIIFVIGDLCKHVRGMEPWLLGWFSLGMYLHLNFVTMFWVIVILIMRCRYVRNGKDIQQDILVEWVSKKWNNFRLSLTP